MTQLVLDEDREPAIIVGADVNMATRTSEYSPDGERFRSYCRFFAEEMLPFIENKYAVRRDKGQRILAGDSLGGTVSLHLALDYRDLFCQVISLSGAFFYGNTRERLAQETDLSWLKMYMLIGLQETEVKTERGTHDFLEHNRLTKPLLEEKGARVCYLERDGVHLWGFWQKELPEALRYFGE